MKRQLALAIAVFFLAGCGGGGGNSSVPGTSSTKSQAKTTNGSVVLSIPVASATTQASSRNVRYPQFVSPYASSVALSVNGGADLLFDVSTSSSLCTAGTGARNCTLNFGAAAGNDTFAFIIYEGPNGTGTQLATANTTKMIASGTAFNFIVALNPVIGTIIPNVTLNGNQGNCPNSASSFNGINEGCAGSVPVTFTVEDPSGATITGSTPYAAPITFTTSDPSLSVTPSQITAPGQSATFSYSGAPFATGVTTTANVTLNAGGYASNLTFSVDRAYLYVANANATPGSPVLTGGGNVAVYTFGSSGSTPPVREIFGSNTGLQTPLATVLDSSGNLYVLDNGIASGSPYNPTIFVFAPDVTGNVPPLRSINNLGSITPAACTDMVLNPAGDHLFVACGSEVYVFPIGASGLGSSAISNSFQDDSVSEHSGLAFDQTGDLYISDDSTNLISVISAPVPTVGTFEFYGGAHSLTPPTSWSSSLLPLKMFVDDAGTLYAPLLGSTGELAIFAGGTQPCTNCLPTTVFTGTPFTTPSVAGVTVDPAGNVYVANAVTNAISVFSRATVTAGSTNNPAALHTINNTSTGATGAYGMTIGP